MTDLSSAQPGSSTSGVEVTNVSRHGFWLLLDERELFAPFGGFPFFRDATIGALTDVRMPHPDHPYWPLVDVDLSVDSIEHPERYPLVSRARTRVAEPGQSQE